MTPNPLVQYANKRSQRAINAINEAVLLLRASMNLGTVHQFDLLTEENWQPGLDSPFKHLVIAAGLKLLHTLDDIAFDPDDNLREGITLSAAETQELIKAMALLRCQTCFPEGLGQVLDRRSAYVDGSELDLLWENPLLSASAAVQLSRLEGLRHALDPESKN